MTKRRLPVFIYFRSLREARQWWPHIAIIVASGLLWIPLGLLNPLPFKIILDNVLGAQPLPDWLGFAAGWSSDGLLYAAIAAGVVLAVLALAHSTGEWLLRENVAEQMVRCFRGKMFLHALQLSPLDKDDKGSYDQTFRINHDAQALQWTAIYGFMPLIISGASIVSMLAVTWQMSPRLAMVAIATSVPLLLLIHLNQRRMCDRWHKVRDLDSTAASVVVEALGAHNTVATCGQEHHEMRRMMDSAQLAFKARLRVMVGEGLWGAALTLSTTVGGSLILYLGVRDVMHGAMSVGDLTVVLAYIGQLYAPLKAIGSHMSSQQTAIASAERAFELFDRMPQVRDAEDALPLIRSRGQIEFRDVSLTYANGHQGLKTVSFLAQAGTCVGIVGRTGAGKTTLLNLLLRLLDPTEGQILLDGLDIRRYRVGDLRGQFSVVTQEPTLFSTSIGDNIAYASPGASREQIVEAAKAAKAHDFILRLPQGYDTPVGERGARLSGGERQRIALARAFLKQAPILILDEPTSAVDTGTEAGIIDSIEALMQGRTTFIVTHRMSALRDVDMVLRVDGGEVRCEPPPEAAAPAALVPEAAA